MGAENVFTPEELAALGETPAEPAPGGQDKPPAADGASLAPAEGEATSKPDADNTPKPEHTDEEKLAIEAEGAKVEVDAKSGKTWIIDDEGTRIPLTRWRKLYHEAQEAKRGQEESTRKLTLFRELGADRYYEIYPQEKPADYRPAGKPAEQGAPQAAEVANYGSMVVNGGPHDGKTLNEVYAEDPAYATSLLNSHLDGQRQAAAAQAEAQSRILQESEREINDFTAQLSSELFGKQADKLTKDEERRVEATIQETLAWMAKTGRGGAVIADGYFLMNREKILTDAEARGGKKALESLAKGGGAPPSIGGGGGGGTPVMGAYESYTAEQMAAAIENMTDAQAAKFYREATPEIRKKFPGLPWNS